MTEDAIKYTMICSFNFRDNEYGGVYGPYRITSYRSGEEGK